MTTEGKKVYRPNELREPYGLTRDTVFKLISEGKLKSFTVGRGRFIRAEAIEEYLQERERAAS